MDADETNTIDYRDFVSACLAPSEYLEEDCLRPAFNYFDVDKDGAISHDDLSRCLGTVDLTEGELDEII